VFPLLAMYALIIRVYLYNNDQINNVTSMNVPNVKYYLIAGLFTSFKCELGRERARWNRIEWSVLDFELYTFVLVIQIRTSRYLESTISLKKDDRTYTHIWTSCKGTVSQEVFTQWLRFYFWGFTLAHVICLILTG